MKGVRYLMNKYFIILIFYLCNVNIVMGENKFQNIYLPISIGNEWKYKLEVYADNKIWKCYKSSDKIVNIEKNEEGFIYEVLRSETNKNYTEKYKVTDNSLILLWKDSKTGEITEHIELVFPLEVNQSWEVFPEGTLGVSKYGKVLETGLKVGTPAGIFQKCIKVQFTAKTPYSNIYIFRWYAPGVGLIQEISEGNSKNLLYKKVLVSYNNINSNTGKEKKYRTQTTEK